MSYLQPAAILGDVNLDRYPRVALFTDCFEESDRMSRTSRQLDKFASRNGLPFLTIHSGATNNFERIAESRYLRLERSRIAFRFDGELFFDPLLLRHYSTVREVLADFRPDVIHVTGPGDAGLLGLYCSRTGRVPLVASWHRNVHEHVSYRLRHALPSVPLAVVRSVELLSERGALYPMKLFYRRAQVLLAPDEGILEMLHRTTGRPGWVMRRGIDTSFFSPSKRVFADGVCRIGFCGRLSTETNVRFFAELEQSLRRRTSRPFRFLIVGDGSERSWLERNLKNAEFTGVLRGAALARAYARMDIFTSPSKTVMSGTAVLEAMASGVPAVVMAKGGSRFMVEHGITGFVRAETDDFVRGALSLLTNRELRRRMALASCIHARQWSWTSVCETVYRAYRFAVRSTPLSPTQLPMSPPNPCPVT